jgi:hypothetical protein
MTSASADAHLADSFQGLPDAHVTVKYLTPKSKGVSEVQIIEDQG